MIDSAHPYAPDTPRRAGAAPILFALLASGWFCTGAVGEVPLGEPFPHFSLTATDGTKFDSKDELKDSAAIITFWRPAQSYSEKALQDLQKIHEEFQGDGLKVIGICSGTDDADEVSAAATEQGVTFTLLLDTDRALRSSLGVFVTPATCIVDKEGVLRFYHPSHTKNFLPDTQFDASFVLGNVSEEDRAKRAEAKASTVKRTSSKKSAHYRLGMRMLINGDREAAREQFLGAWDSDDKSAEAGIELGFLLLEDESYGEALGVFTEAAELAPYLPRGAGGKAAALIRSGKREEGRALLESALEKFGDDPLLCYEMGLLFEQDGDSQEAASYFRRGLEEALKN